MQSENSKTLTKAETELIKTIRSLEFGEVRTITVWFVGIYGIFFQGLCTPSVIASDAMNIEIYVHIDEITVRKFKGMSGLFNVTLHPRPCPETERLKTFYTQIQFPVRKSHPSDITAIAILLRCRIVDNKVVERQ